MARPRGRPKHEKSETLITQAVTLAGVGMPHAQMAKIMGIALETLLKYYADELAEGKAKSSFNIARTLYGEAVGEKNADGTWRRAPNLTALIYWTKAQMGWREASILQTQQLNANGEPVDPPKLGISFEDGGPGRSRRVPFDQEADERVIKSLPPGADKLN